MPLATSAVGSPSIRAGVAMGALVCQPVLCEKSGRRCRWHPRYCRAGRYGHRRPKVDGVVTLAAGHELRYADGASVGAFDVERTRAAFSRQQQKVFEFAAEEPRAWRVIERQRRQCFENA